MSFYVTDYQWLFVDFNIFIGLMMMLFLSNQLFFSKVFL